MEYKSLWTKEISLNKKISQTINDFKVDVLIIGGGITGMTTAYYLKDSNLNIGVIDKSYVGMGVTSCSTGKLTYLQGDIYSKLTKIHSIETAKAYLEASRDAITNVKQIIEKEQIDCNFETVNSYLYATNKKEITKVQKEEKLLNQFGVKTYPIEKNFIIPVYTGFYVKDTAVFHPVKYVRSLYNICKNKIKIIEHVVAKKIERFEKEYLIYTDQNKIRAKHVIVTTHYPFFIIPGCIPFRTHLERSYIACSKTNSYQQICGINIKDPIDSIRYYKNNDSFILYSSMSHKMTDSICYSDKYAALTKRFIHKFQTKPIYEWMTHDVITNDLLPFIGTVSKNKPNFLFATGFRKWGMTNGSIAGKILSDIVLNRENKYIELFSPHRTISLEKIKNFIIDTFSYSKIMTRTTLIKNHNFYPDTTYIIRKKGIPYGVYIDTLGKSHIVKNKCPHFKCNLIFNSVDKTWDCPCHGSRFSIDGDLLEGPSTSTIKR